jgi:hypothetical protein
MKIKYTCECGSILLDSSKNNHEKSKKHLNFIGRPFIPKSVTPISKAVTSIVHNEKDFCCEHIDSFFTISTKATNDLYNKIRENIIADIINDKIPTEYFITDKRWVDIKKGIFDFIKILTKDEAYSKIECERKGGRSNYRDFDIKITKDEKTVVHTLEFKYNALSIETTPQFVSPTKPSNFLSSSYEEYYYDNYLFKLGDFSNLQIPNKKDYLKQINSNKPKCMEPYKKLYKTNKEFNNLANDCFYKSCSSFIENNDLNKEKLSDYLYNSQQHKIYMLYFNGKFNIQYDDNQYSIVNVVKGKSVKTSLYTKYICETKNGRYIDVLLRWKNGNGIAFPAFQVSWKK